MGPSWHGRQDGLENFTTAAQSALNIISYI